MIDPLREPLANLVGESALARARERASLHTAALLPGAALIGLMTGTLAPLALAGPLALAFLVRGLRAFAAPHNTLPNLITALRVVLTGLLALTAGAASVPPWGQALGVLSIFVLDGLDGLLARSLHASSAQGAHFDMEADAYLILTVCSMHALSGHGVWVLSGGLLRYAYTLATALFPSRGEAPRSRFGRYSFAASLAALTLALVVPRTASLALSALATAILLISFGRSFYWAFRRA